MQQNIKNSNSRKNIGRTIKHIVKFHINWIEKNRKMQVIYRPKPLPIPNQSISEFDLCSFIPTIYSQGNINCSSANAIILLYRMYRIINKMPDIAISRLWLYYMERYILQNSYRYGITDSDLFTPQLINNIYDDLNADYDINYPFDFTNTLFGLNIITKMGGCLETDFTYDLFPFGVQLYEKSLIKPPPNTLVMNDNMQNALYNSNIIDLIYGFKYINSSDLISNIKLQLVNLRPIIIRFKVMTTNSNYMNPYNIHNFNVDNNCYTTLSDSNYQFFYIEHSVVIVGWNDNFDTDIDGLGAFIVANSFGQRGIERKIMNNIPSYGFNYMSYRYIETEYQTNILGMYMLKIDHFANIVFNPIEPLKSVIIIFKNNSDINIKNTYVYDAEHRFVYMTDNGLTWNILLEFYRATTFEYIIEMTLISNATKIYPLGGWSNSLINEISGYMTVIVDEN